MPARNPTASTGYSQTPPLAIEANAAPEFATIPDTRKLMGIPRSTLYELESEGRIRFVRLRKHGNLRGRVLVDLASVRSFLARCAVENQREAAK